MEKTSHSKSNRISNKVSWHKRLSYFKHSVIRPPLQFPCFSLGVSYVLYKPSKPVHILTTDFCAFFYDKYQHHNNSVCMYFIFLPPEIYIETIITHLKTVIHYSEHLTLPYNTLSRTILLNSRAASSVQRPCELCKRDG